MSADHFAASMVVDNDTHEAGQPSVHQNVIAGVDAAASSMVVDALFRACSQNAAVLKPAEAQLKSWEALPGFYSTLASVFLRHDMDVSMRWLAVLYFKNGVDRYWRRNAPNSISEDEKNVLKRHLIANFNEPVNQIATQLSVLIGKIARLDCPRTWPDLIPVLMDAIRVEDVLQQQRAALTLYHVIKSLASKRLAPDRKVFEDLTSNIFDLIFMTWQSNCSCFMAGLQSSDAGAVAMSLDRSILSLKILQKLVVFGFEEVNKNQSALEFLNLVFHWLDQFLLSKSNLQKLNNEDLLLKREKIVTLFSKVLLAVLEFHVETFAQFIRPSLEMVVLYCFTSGRTELVFERFVVNALNLMRNILHCEDYHPAKIIEETKNPVTLLAHRTKMDFFTKDVLNELCRCLVLQYFLFSQEDLNCWDSDPESFTSDESGDLWKFSLRPCTEHLYLSLVKEFRDVLSPMVIDLVRENEHFVDPTDLPALLRKDAVYNAVGIASYDFYDLINFDEWFQTKLLSELQIKHPNCRIIRRRVIWLVGTWLGVKLSSDLRPCLYDCITSLMDRSEDLVIRMEAALTLKLAVDDFEFKSEQYLPHLERHFGLLFQILNDVSQSESKMTMLHIMSLIIERMQSDIKPHSESLIRYLPMLWDASEHHNLLRCAIITTLTTLVQSIGTQCANMYDILLPVIKLSTDAACDQHVYLCEDGLDLWLSMLHCSPVITPPLLDVFENMAPLLELGTETLKVSLKIIEAYILLGPNEFLQRYHAVLLSSLSKLLNDIKMEGEILIYKVVEIALKTCPNDGPIMFDSMIITVFQSIINSELQSISSMQFPAVTTMLLALISRIILNNPHCFYSLVDRVAAMNGQTSVQTLETFIDRWIDKQDLVIQPERKKLCTLALATLLTTNNSIVLQRFNGILNSSVEALHDVCRSDSETGIFTDFLFVSSCFIMPSDQSFTPDDLETENDKRRHQLSMHDPVYTVSLPNFILSQLNTLQSQIGHTGMQSLMNSLDCEVSHQLNHFLKMVQ